MQPKAILSALAVAAVLCPAVASAADLKIGYVDLQKALSEVEEGKAAKAVLKKDFDEKQKELDRKQEELKRMRADLDKQSVVMSDQARREKEEEFQRKAMETQGRFLELQKDLSGREREMTRGIFERMSVIIREIAEAEGFTMIFEKTDSGLLYAPPALDISNELIRKYNARHKAGASAKAEKKADDKKSGKK